MAEIMWPELGRSSSVTAPRSSPIAAWSLSRSKSKLRLLVRSTKHGVQLRVGRHASKARFMDQELLRPAARQPPPLIASPAIVGGIRLRSHPKTIRLAQSPATDEPGPTAWWPVTTELVPVRAAAVAIFSANLAGDIGRGSRRFCGRKLHLT